MNETLARQMALQLSDSEVGGWRVAELLGWGRSALVVRATKDGHSAALKIYDAELIAQYGGEDAQTVRIQRQLALRGHGHEGLVDILDGGRCHDTGRFFLAMGYLPHPTLSQVVSVLPRERIRPLLLQLATTVRFLEEQELVHRDIKPDNICVSPDFERLRLLDLGVLRPLGSGDLTDGTDHRPFLGTLRYSPPEYLLRTEDDSLEGWRAVSFYQIGAALHDMIVRTPLFAEDSEPYARLVMAVCTKTPQVVAPDVAPALVALARNCLVKDPSLRLELVSWESFAGPDPDVQSLDVEGRVRARLRVPISGTAGPPVPVTATTTALLARRIERLARTSCSGSELFPPVEVRHAVTATGTAIVTVSCDSSVDHGLPLPLAISLQARMLEPESNTVALDGSAFFGTLGSNEEPPQPARLYAGDASDDVLQARVHAALVVFLDAAQVSAVNLALQGNEEGWYPVQSRPSET